ncbi:MAG: hypothetical protein M3Q22_10290 [Actinomycetota bacterium]|nr:hypothetical protein [Actinomycetota bacterium]
MPENDDTAEHRGTASPPGMPLWVKAAAVVVGLLLVVYLVLQLTGLGGGHGPGMHSSSGLPSAPGEAAMPTAGR